MAHPHLLAGCHAFEQGIRTGKVELRHAVFALFALFDGSVEQMRNELKTVADAEHWHNPAGEKCSIQRGTAGFVDAGGPARYDDTLAMGEFNRRRFTRTDIGVDAELAHFPRDEMCVLAARVEDGYLWSHSSFV